MKKAIPWIIAAVIVAGLIGAWAAFGNGILQWYYSSQASAALKDGRPERAVEMFEKQLSLTPNDDSLRLRLATLLADEGIFSRAEYHLANGISQVSDPVPLYLKLCEVYVRQDKLRDARALFDGISNSRHASAVAQECPAPPVLNPPPGTYNEIISVSVDVPEGYRCFISWEGEIPSVAKDEYAQPVQLGPGTTSVRAIMVDDRGVVSEWTAGEYHLEDVIYQLAFADRNIESLVRLALDIPEGPVRSSDVAELTELVSEVPASYTTLDDLLHLPALEKLSLTGEDGECDISALPLLTGVTDLRLDRFGIDSVTLESIGQMEWLRHLSLESNMIADISLLGGLTQLETLRLGTNSILDLAPIAGMTGLAELRAAQNAVQDLTPLAGLSQLRILELANNRVVTLEGLGALGKLEVLDISHNYVQYVEAVAGLPMLSQVLASHNKIDNADAFATLPALTELALASNLLTSVSAFSGNTSLKRMDISGNSVTSLDGLDGCPGLSYLEASKNQIASVEPLKGHPSIAELRVESNAIKTLAPLLTCPALKEVYAFGNSLTDPADAFLGTGITVYRN